MIFVRIQKPAASEPWITWVESIWVQSAYRRTVWGQSRCLLRQNREGINITYYSRTPLEHGICLDSHLKTAVDARLQWSLSVLVAIVCLLIHALPGMRGYPAERSHALSGSDSQRTIVDGSATSAQLVRWMNSECAGCAMVYRRPMISIWYMDRIPAVCVAHH